MREWIDREKLERLKTLASNYLARAYRFLGYAAVNAFNSLENAYRKLKESAPESVSSAYKPVLAVLAIFLLYFSLTSFLGLSFYAGMTTQDAFTDLVNLTSEMEEVSLRYGSQEEYPGCDFAREISSVTVPCSVLSGGTGAVTDYVSSRSPASRDSVIHAVSGGAYRQSPLASSHYTALALIPVALTLAALSGLLVSITTDSFVETLRRVDVAVLSSGLALLTVKPLLVRYIAARAVVSSTEPATVLVLAGELSTVPAFSSQLSSLVNWGVGLAAAGTFLLAVSYSGVKYRFYRKLT